MFSDGEFTHTAEKKVLELTYEILKSEYSKTKNKARFSLMVEV